MTVMPGPLIVNQDFTIMLAVDHPQADAARAAIAPFAELERAPEHIHTYRLTRLGLWNAAALGYTAQDLTQVFAAYTAFPVAPQLLDQISEIMSRYGKVRIISPEPGQLALAASSPEVFAALVADPTISPLLAEQLADLVVAVQPAARGELKLALYDAGWPAADEAGYTEGDPLAFEFTPGWSLRDYQSQAAAAFAAGGSGVVLLPCGAGKTLVGAAAMEKLQCATLILVNSIVAGQQWARELENRTTLQPEQIGQYNGEQKQIRPVTIASYQVLSRGKLQNSALELFSALPWGLIIYDEVHMLPAEVFRLSATIQATRRLGLTATLVREDGREGDVFTLIGPKRYDLPWKQVEQLGFIAQASCTEVRVAAPDTVRRVGAEQRAGTLTARAAAGQLAGAPEKIAVIKRLLELHAGQPTIIIGCYLDQLEELSAALKLPLIQGKTPNKQRTVLYDEFRSGKTTALLVSKVGNFSIDLPSATVLIQVSGTWSSRQEEAQRLGRVLRPKAGDNRAFFYSLVTADSKEQEMAAWRQRFLTEQGYQYRIIADGVLWEEQPESST